MIQNLKVELVLKIREGSYPKLRLGEALWEPVEAGLTSEYTVINWVIVKKSLIIVTSERDTGDSVVVKYSEAIPTEDELKLLEDRVEVLENAEAGAEYLGDLADVVQKGEIVPGQGLTYSLDEETGVSEWSNGYSTEIRDLYNSGAKVSIYGSKIWMESPAGVDINTQGPITMANGSQVAVSSMYITFDSGSGPVEFTSNVYTNITSNYKVSVGDVGHSIMPELHSLSYSNTFQIKPVATEGGYVSLEAPDNASGAGGDIDISAGNGSTDGGIVRIQGGSGSTDGGVEITSGYTRIVSPEGIGLYTELGSTDVTNLEVLEVLGIGNAKFLPNPRSELLAEYMMPETPGDPGQVLTVVDKTGGTNLLGWVDTSPGGGGGGDSLPIGSVIMKHPIAPEFPAGWVKLDGSVEGFDPVTPDPFPFYMYVGTGQGGPTVEVTKFWYQIIDSTTNIINVSLNSSARPDINHRIFISDSNDVEYDNISVTPGLGNSYTLDFSLGESDSPVRLDHPFFVHLHVEGHPDEIVRSVEPGMEEFT